MRLIRIDDEQHRGQRRREAADCRAELDYQRQLRDDQTEERKWAAED
jgi:hypothetical protein